MGVKEKILVVDFGSQYSHLIVQKIRKLGVFSELVSPDHNLNEVNGEVKGIVLSGGPSSVYEESAPRIPLDHLPIGKIPILGICYGYQLIAYLLGGRVKRGFKGEYGKVILHISSDHVLLKNIPPRSIVWMSHKDVVERLPSEFITLGYTENSPIAIMANDKIRVYGVQFHPEVDHTEYGMQFLRNFIYDICRCRGGWRPIDLVRDFISKHKVYSSERALMAVSGGVDSTVTAIILREVFNDNLYVVFIDTGLLRCGESEYVKELFIKKLKFKNFYAYNASDLFLSRLNGITDPEEKRRVISDTFFEIFERIANNLRREVGPIKFLGQGTLYPDRVESGVTSRYADRIKSHHNVVISRKLGFTLLEPLKDLYKDEVREIAKQLGVPKEVYTRHPFPGPGLAIRIVGEVTKEKLDILRKADKIVEEELRKSCLYDNVWQGFPVLLSLKSVGIKGDKRSYEYMIAIRIVHSLNAMTASFAKVDWDILERIANRILNEVEGVNRVLYDISNKPPATIEFE